MLAARQSTVLPYRATLTSSPAAVCFAAKDRSIAPGYRQQNPSRRAGGYRDVRSDRDHLSVRSGRPKSRQRLFKLQNEYLITLSDAVIAVKTDAGPVKLNQLVNTTAIGAASGSFWGLLIGLIFLNPLLGVALGAASGALGGALSDYGIDDAFMKKLSETLQPGNAALFVLVKNMTPDKVLREIQDAGGTVLKTSLDDSKEQKLRDALAKACAEQATPKTNVA